MKNFNFKSLLPHIVALVAFLALSIAFTKPALEGKVLEQHDVQQVKAMQQQSIEFKNKYGYYPRWTNSMFSGMPTYQILIAPKSGQLTSVTALGSVFSLGLPKPVYFLFLACACFYMLCIVIGINPWLSILGGIAYGYCSYNPILVSVGHDTKLMSMAYAPAVIASMILIFNKKYWIGGSLLVIFTSLLIAQSHQQIVYYTLIMTVFIAIHYIIKAIKAKEYVHLLKALSLNALMAITGVLISSFVYFAAFEYTSESNRGGSKLTAAKKEEQSKGGLDKGYAFQYSYGKDETFSFIVPNATGGGSATPLGDESKAIEMLQQMQQTPNVNPQLIQEIAQSSSAYWGGKAGTSGPVYFGAIICLLFLFGAFLTKTEHKWWIITLTILGTVLAWGRHFEAFNYFLFDHLPFYNKFRTPEMANVIPQLAVPLLAVIFVNQLIQITDKEVLTKLAKKILIITGGVAALLGGFYLLADFKNESTTELKKFLESTMGNNPEFIRNYIGALVKDRQAIYLSDMWRSLGFILVGFAAVYLYCKQLIKAPVLLGALILLTTFDLVNVGKRYLTFDSFVEAIDYDAAYADYNADIQIKRDPGFFRVMNLAFKGGGGNFQVSLNQAFNDAIASYKHNTIGGYHPAKLSIYADLVERQLYKNIEHWGANPNAKDSFPVLNMLNMKYVIVPDQANPKQTTAVVNPYAMGNCWLVKNIQYVPTADAEMSALDHLNPAETVVIQDEYKSKVAGNPVYDSTATIKMVENKNDEIKYEFNANSNQFAVFSEIYYSKGWDAYIDGKKTDFCKVNYVLRGMSVPAGKHTIEFKFDSSFVDLGEKLENYATIFAYLFILLSIFMTWKNSKKQAV